MSERKGRKHARAMLNKAGYFKLGGHVKGEKKMVEDGVHEHESALHKGKPKTKLKLRDGGKAEGGEPKMRADRLARGGRSKGHKGGKSHVTVNVVNAHPQAKPVPVPVPVPAGGPGGGPPPGAMAPPGAGPMPPPDQGPPPGMNRGGKVKKAKMNSQRDAKGGMPAGHFHKGGRAKGYPIDAGAGGGKGRLEKAKAQARK